MDDRIENLIYLGNCNFYGWRPTDEGRDAFLCQLETGRRDSTGRMIWPERKETVVERGV